MKHGLADEPSGSDAGSASLASDDAGSMRKRARVDSQDGQDEQDMSDADMSQDAPQQAPEEFAEAFQGRSKSGGGRQTGLIAGAGIIEQVELRNFMCHTHVSVNFGPQLNFLIGHNGSGKSAVLTGISIALGSSAKATNRGENNKDLVKAGENFAICAVKLKNKGPDAFKPSIYGSSITVERRISKEGVSSYKLKNHEGRVIETKKIALEEILDRFNIQVENPLTVLTQDQSRAFLATSTPKEKYVFWLRGTQLAQLTTEYEIIRANTETMQELLDRKREVVPELKEAFRVAKAKAKDAEAALAQRDRLVGLRNILAWSYVEEVEERITTTENAILNAQSRVEKLQKELIAKETAISDADNERMTWEEGLAEIDDEGKGRREELLQIAEQAKAHKELLKAWMDSKREANTQVKSVTDSIAALDHQIAEEQAKLARDIVAERAPIQQRIDHLKQEADQLVEAVEKSRQLEQQMEVDRDRAKAQLNEIKDQISRATDAYKQVEGQIRNLQTTNKDPLRAFTDNMAALVHAINNERGWNQKPIGPLGRCVKLKDPKYSSAIDAFFAETLNAFVVTNAADRDRLIRMQRAQKASFGTPIIMQRPDGQQFYADLARNEPAEDLLTIRRNMTFADPLVEQVLINARSIEAQVLVPQRRDGDAVIRSGQRNVLSCFSADMFRIFGGDGSLSSFNLRHWSKGSRLGADNSDAIREAEGRLLRIGADIERFKQEAAQYDQQARQLHQQLTQAVKDRRAMAERAQRRNAEIENLQQSLREEEPSNLAHLQTTREEAQQELQTLVAQFQAIEENKPELDAAIWDRKKELDKVEKESDKVRVRAQKSLEESIRKRLNASNEKAQFEQRVNELVENLNQQTTTLDELQAELDTISTQAKAVCAERPENPKKKTTAKLIQDINSLEAALKRGDAQRGATLEELFAEVEVRKVAAQTAVNMVNDLAMLIKVLNKAYDERIMRWNSFRESMAARARAYFVDHLSQRGFTGKLAFHHTKLTLLMLVNPNQNSNAQAGSSKGSKSRAKNTQALSGGEKSYATICLLLTMWDLLSGPIRCVDEFDVFMDSVNRKISMNMISEAAKRANNAQHILITPLDIANVAHGPEVRINRMHDPGRNTGTLRFGAADA